MVETPQAEPASQASPSDHKELSLLPGIAFTGFGALFLAPLFYRADAFGGDDLAVERLLGLSMGIAFLLIGLPALARVIRNRRRQPSESDFLAPLERVFFGTGHLVVIVTLIGMSGLVFFDMRGGVSGVPVGMGMLIAGLMYACGGVCRALR